MTIPQMQQRYTGYDFGGKTANSFLDAIRIKNRAESEDRRLGILEASEKRMATDYRRRLNTDEMVNRAILGQLKNRQEDEDLKDRINTQGKGATLPYRIAQTIQDIHNWINPLTESPEQMRIRQGGGTFLPEHELKLKELEGFEGNVSRLYPFFFQKENLLQGAMMGPNLNNQTQSQSNNTGLTQNLRWNPTTNQYE